MNPVKQSRMRQSGAGQKMVSDQQPKATMVVAMARWRGLASRQNL